MSKYNNRFLFYLLYCLGLGIKHRSIYHLVRLGIKLKRTLRPISHINAEELRTLYLLDGSHTEINGLYTDAMVNKMYYYLDLFALIGGKGEEWIERIVINNKHYFDTAIANGRPNLFLQLHSGSFYLLLVWFAMFWEKTGVLYFNASSLRETVHDFALQQYCLQKLRTYKDVENMLIKGKSCMLMIDGGKFNRKYAEDVKINGISLNFPTSPLSLARTTGCNIIPVLSRRLSWKQIEFTFYPPHLGSATASMQEIIDSFWADLKRDPRQWYIVLENIHHIYPPFIKA